MRQAMEAMLCIGPTIGEVTETLHSSISGHGEICGLRSWLQCNRRRGLATPCSTATRGSIRAPTSARQTSQPLQHLLRGGIFSLCRMGQTVFRLT